MARVDRYIDLIPGTSKAKRVASSQLQAEPLGNKRMRNDWLKLTNLVKRVKNMSDVYLSEWSDLGTLLLIVHDPSLDDSK